ncbi:universal stress protein [Desulfovibrio inopinatus]|uniref:universal stress protein n=1 Tax=Desulfovibrio inopinatus TaxID=102109 RepID=UPI0003FB10A7|nr:universal stress protein [Desulfovibrio inopinatus]
MFKDILLAITPSAMCECAADSAIAFAQRFEANLYIVHVCGIEQGWGEIEFMASSGATEKLKANIESYYAEKLKGVSSYQIFVVPGMPHTEILRLARKLDTDLIVMGPHTKEYAEKRALMWGMAGSTVEKVSRHARCPVIIVTKETPYGEQKFSNILVATDFSKQSRCAVNYGGQMARQYNAALTVLNVLDVSGKGQTLAQDEIVRELEDRKKEMIDKYAQGLAGIKSCTYECCEGSPAIEILKMARGIKADLVIMAHHSKEVDPEQALLGSTVAQVSMNSLCPTMSVNHHFDMRCGLMYDQGGAVTATG